MAKLAQDTQPGDNLLFYFSGHGDVETITQFNNGYLLAYDTYSNNYIAGALPVSFLKELFVTLLNKNVKIIMITDACKSGKLAGGMKGAEYVAASISNMWNNEIKMLSTQPGKLSYEDSKWGNGQGVFSYYLIKGLNGEADANKDSLITLVELENYVGNNVARETGNEQQPIVEGPNKFSTVLVRLSDNKKISTGNRPGGNSFSIPAKKWWITADSCNYYYSEMSKAIREEKFNSSDQLSATAFYKKLKSCTRDTGLILQANSQLLAGLMNSAQEIVNNSFIGKSLVSEEKYKHGIDLLDQVIRNNDLHLPYEAHLQNLKRYLDVQGRALWNDSVQTQELEPILDSALKEEPDAAYLVTAKGTLEMLKKNWSTAIPLLENAIGKSPGWLMPKYYLGNCYGSQDNYKKALDYYEEIFQKDSTYRTFECTKCILQRMAEYALKTKQEKRSIEYLFKSLDLFPEYGPAYNTLYEYITVKKDRVAAEKFISYLKKFDDSTDLRLTRIHLENDVLGRPVTLQALDSVKRLLLNNLDSANYYASLADYYSGKKNFDRDSVYDYYSRAIELDSTEISYLLNFSEFLSTHGDPAEARDMLHEKLHLFSGQDKAELQQELSNLYLDSGNYEEAFDIVKDLFARGFLTCTDLRKMKKAFKGLPEYEAYLKKCKD